MDEGGVLPRAEYDLFGHIVTFFSSLFFIRYKCLSNSFFFNLISIEKGDKKAFGITFGIKTPYNPFSTGSGGGSGSESEGGGESGGEGGGGIEGI